MKLSKIIIIFFLVALGIGVFFVFKNGTSPEPAKPQTQSSPAAIDPNGPPKIVATKPDPLDENIVSASDIVEITFNRSLENVGEFKSRIEPKIEYKVELSGDRKTARIIPAKPYPLGTTFTLSIGPDSKFDGAGAWGQDKTFHFKTIKYNGV